MKAKIAGILSIFGVTGSSLLINKFHSYPLEKPTKSLYTFSTMKREPIFDNPELFTNELNPVFNHLLGSNEPEIEESLKKFITTELKKLFHKRGWNFEELGGRIYYEIKNKSVEIYVIWKNSIYDKNYTFYDRFEIILF